MENPYRTNAAQIQNLYKQTAREFLGVTAYEKRYAGNSKYNGNFVAVSGGNPFDAVFQDRLDELTRKVTDDSDSSDL